MKGIKHLPEATQIALTKQFEIIEKEKDIPNIDFKDEETPFFRKYTWTEEEEQEFTNWFIDKLITDKEFRKLLQFTNKPKRRDAQKAAYEWNLMYGFKTIEGGDCT